MVAFSRGRRPVRPTRCDRLIATPGISSATISAASFSIFGSTRAKTEQIATAEMPRARQSRHAARIATSSSGAISEPS
ncbi:hypothetical protein D3C87_2058210 [compost metagenome]